MASAGPMAAAFRAALTAFTGMRRAWAMMRPAGREDRSEVRTVLDGERSAGLQQGLCRVGDPVEPLHTGEGGSEVAGQGRRITDRGKDGGELLPVGGRNEPKSIRSSLSSAGTSPKTTATPGSTSARTVDAVVESVSTSVRGRPHQVSRRSRSGLFPASSAVSIESEGSCIRSPTPGGRVTARRRQRSLPSVLAQLPPDQPESTGRRTNAVGHQLEVTPSPRRLSRRGASPRDRAGTEARSKGPEPEPGAGKAFAPPRTRSLACRP
ncbi:hypothetical protein SMICM304S_10851 [Streptomyces microflavus]